MLTQLSPSRIAALTIAALISILAFTGTAGAQIIGSKCASNSGAPTTLFTTATASGESYVVPFDGVLTEWGTDRTHAGANEGVVAALLGAKSGSDWTVVGSTGFQYIPANSGAVSYAARISVGAGQTLGTTTFNTMPVMCETGSPLGSQAF